jgi:hypothetical protein
MFPRNPPDELRKMIASYKPAVVGFSIRNMDAYSRTKTESFLPPVRELVSVAKNEGVVSVLVWKEGDKIQPKKPRQHPGTTSTFLR